MSVIVRSRSERCSKFASKMRYCESNEGFHLARRESWTSSNGTA